MNDKISFSVKNRLKIKPEQFKILMYESYKNLERYNYNVNQLKIMCKHYKLKCSGNKTQIQERLYNYLKYYKYAVIIQKNYRRHLIKKINDLKGPAILNRKLCCNKEDLVTLENINNIKYNNFFSFKHNNQIYGFDIQSIYKYLIKQNNNINPYDRSIFDNSIKEQLLNLKKKSKLLKLNIVFEEIIKEKKITIHEIFDRIEELGNYTKYEWFEELNYNNLLKFYKELYDIWIYRANLTNQMRYNICKINLFPVLPNFYINYTKTELTKILINIMHKLLHYAVDFEYQKLGAVYILTALTLVSEPAAEALPWLYNSVI